MKTERLNVEYKGNIKISKYISSVSVWHFVFFIYLRKQGTIIPMVPKDLVVIVRVLVLRFSIKNFTVNTHCLV